MTTPIHITHAYRLTPAHAYVQLVVWLVASLTPPDNVTSVALFGLN